MDPLDQLSDEELAAVASGKATLPSPKAAQAPAPDALDELSDDELMQIASGQATLNPQAKPKQSIGQSILGTIGEVGEVIDQYTGAPTRAAIHAAQKGQNPIDAFGYQFGGNPKNAPTGKQIAQEAGISDAPLFPHPTGGFGDHLKDPLNFLHGVQTLPEVLKDKIRDLGITRSGAAGLAIDATADPLVAVGPVAKGLGLLSKGAKGAQTAGKAATVVKEGNEAVRIAKETAKNATEALSRVFSPKRADDYKDLVKIADKNGIDPDILPESAEFGQSSFISRAARARAEGVTGEAFLKKHVEAINQVQKATDRKITQIGLGAPLGKADAGQALRNGFDDAADNLFNNLDITHDKIIKDYAPGLYIDKAEWAKVNSSLNGVEKWAKGRAMRGITQTQREQANQLLKAVNAVRASKGTYKQTVEAMRMIGEVAFKTSNTMADIPADVAKLRKMYFDLSDSAINTVRKHVNPEFADELLQNNKAMTEFFGDKSILGKALGNKSLSPEGVFDALILNGDTQKVKALKRIYTPEQLQQFKGAFIEHLVKRNPDGGFSFKDLYNAMRRKEDVIRELFEPEEILEIGELIKLGDRMGLPILSTSGTGASNVFKQIPQAIVDATLNDAVIEGMKSRARGKLPSPPAPGAAPKGGGIRIPPRALIGQGVKGSQVISIQNRPLRGPAEEERK